jgi:hypothetical protein
VHKEFRNTKHKFSCPSQTTTGNGREETVNGPTITEAERERERKGGIGKGRRNS